MCGMIKVVYRDGKSYVGHSLEEIMEKMWLTSFNVTATLDEYMEATANRIKALFNVDVERDAVTLILAQALLGVLKIYTGHEITNPKSLIDRLKEKSTQSI